MIENRNNWLVEGDHTNRKDFDHKSKLSQVVLGMVLIEFTVFNSNSSRQRQVEPFIRFVDGRKSAQSCSSKHT